MVNLPTGRDYESYFSLPLSNKNVDSISGLDWLSFLSKLKLLYEKFLDDKEFFARKGNLDKNLSHSLKNAGQIMKTRRHPSHPNSQLTDRFQFDGEKGLSHLVGDLAPVVSVVRLAELLDDEAAPDDVALLALHDREVLRLTASPQLVALHGRE